jgi:hypothetical protein
LALLITVLFLLKDKIFSKKYIYSIAIISMSVILYVSLNRSLLFSRPYFTKFDWICAVSVWCRHGI